MTWTWNSYSGLRQGKSAKSSRGDCPSALKKPVAVLKAEQRLAGAAAVKEVGSLCCCFEAGSWLGKDRSGPLAKPWGSAASVSSLFERIGLSLPKLARAV